MKSNKILYNKIPFNNIEIFFHHLLKKLIFNVVCLIKYLNDRIHFIIRYKFFEIIY